MLRLMVERKRRGWTQLELARRSGLNVTSISLIEVQRFVPSSAQIEKLRLALGVRPDDAPRLLEEIVVEPLAGSATATR